MPAIPALRRLWQEDGCEFEVIMRLHDEFKVSLNYTGRPCLREGQRQRQTHTETHREMTDRDTKKK